MMALTLFSRGRTKRDPFYIARSELVPSTRSRGGVTWAWPSTKSPRVERHQVESEPGVPQLYHVSILVQASIVPTVLFSTKKLVVDLFHLLRRS